MFSLIRIIESFASFRRVPMKVVVVTALTSYVLQLGAILQGMPLYMIAIYTLLPWIPVLAFESLWKIQHYHWMAFFAILTLLQLGHFGEHALQAGTLAFTNGTLACPPPVDNFENYTRAVEAGLRSPEEMPTGYSSSKIVAANKEGLPSLNSQGNEIVGYPACGVFGQLDLELVHLVWEIAGWIATLLIVLNFYRNKWLWVAIAFFTVHSVEHIFISWMFYMDNEEIYKSAYQLWATTAEGKIITAHPVGKESDIVNFYAVAGKFGVFARNGIVGALFPSLNKLMPTRPYLHFYYNLGITVPTLIAFLQEMRGIYDEHLAEALPTMSKEELVQATPRLQPMRFHPGEVIIKQGDIADKFYIIAKGEVEVVHEEGDGSEVVVGQLHQDQYFGEMGILDGGKRFATVRALIDVEVMALDRSTFNSLIESSEMSHASISRVMEQREAGLTAASQAE